MGKQYLSCIVSAIAEAKTGSDRIKSQVLCDNSRGSTENINSGWTLWIRISSILLLIWHAQQECHKVAEAHLPLPKALAWIRDKFHFKNISDTLFFYLQACLYYQQNIASNHDHKQNWQAILLREQNQALGLDVVGPFLSIHWGNTHVLLAMDCGSQCCNAETIIVGMTKRFSFSWRPKLCNSTDHPKAWS